MIQHDAGLQCQRSRNKSLGRMWWPTEQVCMLTLGANNARPAFSTFACPGMLMQNAGVIQELSIG